MNCHAAQRQLSADRDGTLASHEHAALEAHLAGCADCRSFQVSLAGASEHLQVAAMRVNVPDEERAWQDIRRELRASKPAGRAWWSSLRWSLPLGAAAALAVAVALVPTKDDEPVVQTVARADFVEVPGDSSSVVYVDDKSGWLVVWASDARGG